MKAGVCTLFEGNYHQGVVALINSLQQQGFQGTVYAGYKGKLPCWAKAARQEDSLKWKGGSTLYINDKITIHFLPLTTDHHLTNYKPDFLLSLWGGIGYEEEVLFYFDPDIVVLRPWAMYSEWVTCGVALCEDVNSPLPLHHPRRIAWRKYFQKFQIELTAKETMYANGGFIGLQKKDIKFLETWRTIQQAMAVAIGGLGMSMFNNAVELEQSGGAFAPFSKTDQDALNATIEASDLCVSFVAKEGMGFSPGIQLMCHALGSPKPWEINPLKQALAGRPPREADVMYWKLIAAPISFGSPLLAFRKRIELSIAGAIGRFYSRR